MGKLLTFRMRLHGASTWDEIVPETGKQVAVVSATINNPATKTDTVDINTNDGVLDFSEAQGIHYGNRNIEVTLRKIAGSNYDFDALRRKYLGQMVLSPEEIAEILGKIDRLTKFAEDIKDSALTKALDGEEIPGWKVVEGRSIRKYVGSEEEIVRQCEGAGYDQALLYERKLLTITNMEKLMGKKQFAEVLGAYVEKPEGKPTLAPESDKRPAITNNSAAEDFADED